MLFVFVIYLGLPIAAFAYSHDVIGTILLISLTFAYLIGICPANALLSPSFEILRAVDRQTQRGGLSKEEIINRVGKTALLDDRINDLVNEGLVTAPNNIQLTMLGKCIGAFFYYYRQHILKLPRGTG